MNQRTLTALVSRTLVSGMALLAIPSLAFAQSEPNPLMEPGDGAEATDSSVEDSGQTETRRVTIRTSDAPEPRTRGGAETMEGEESSDDQKGAYFRFAIGGGYSRDQTLEFMDNYSIANGAYIDVEVAPGIKLDEHKAVHLWLHWQYPSISERGEFVANSGEPRSVVDLGIGYTRQSESCPLFIGFNVGVALAFVDSKTDGLRADEVGNPGVGAASELMVGALKSVSDSLSMGFAAVGGARLIFTGDETFNGYYAGGRLIFAID